MADEDTRFDVTLNLDEFIKRKEELVKLCKEIQEIDIDISGTEELEKRISRVNELVKDVKFAPSKGAKEFQSSLNAVNTRKTPHVGIGDAAYLSASARGLDYTDIKNRVKSKKGSKDVDSETLREAKKSARERLKFESATFKAIENSYKLMSLRCRQSMYALEKASKKSWDAIKKAGKKALDATHLTPAINAVKRAASTIATPFTKAFSAVKKEIAAVGRDLGRLNTRLGNPVGKIGRALGTTGRAIGQAGMAAGRYAGGALLTGAGMAATAVGGAIMAAPAAALAAGVMNVRDASSYRDKKAELTAQRDRLSEVAKITGPTDDVINQYIELTKQLELLDFEYRNVSEATKEADKAWLTIKQTTTSLWNTVGELVTEGFAGLGKNVDGIAKAIESVLLPAIAVVVTAFTNWKDVMATVSASVEVSLRTVWEYISWIFTSAIPDVIVGFVKNSPAILGEWGSNLGIILKNIGDLILNKVRGILDWLISFLPKGLQDVWGGIKVFCSRMNENIAKFIGVVWAYLQTLPTKIPIWFKNLGVAFSNGWKGIQGFGKGILDSLSDFWAVICDSVGGLWDKLKAVISNLGANVAKGVEWVWTKLKSFGREGGDWSDIDFANITGGFDDINAKYEQKQKDRQAAKDAKKDEDARKAKEQKEKYLSEGRTENGYYKDTSISFKELNKAAGYKDPFAGFKKDKRKKALKDEQAEWDKAHPDNGVNIFARTSWTETMKSVQDVRKFQASPELQAAQQKLDAATGRLGEGYSKNLAHVKEVFDDKKKEQKEIAEHKQAPIGSAEALQIAKQIQGSSTKSLEDAYNTMNNAATKYSPIVNALKAQEQAQAKAREEQEKREETAEQQREDMKALGEETGKAVLSIWETVKGWGAPTGVKFAEG